MVAEVRRRFAVLDENNLDIEVPSIDFNGMFQCP
jgi:hypothetical protein